MSFFPNVSHEIRTPLSALLGFNELLAEHPYLHHGPPEIGDYLRNIHEHGRMLLALIDDLLDVARIESGQLRLQCEPCSLPQLLNDVVGSIRSWAESKRLTLEMDLGGESPPLISIDRLRLQQILVNLVNNAIKFTEQGGVRLAGRVVDCSGDRALLVISVSDTGVGMTAEEMLCLFQPFYRVRTTCGDAPRGTGLGLTISRRLAQQLGGDVTVQSTPAVGTRFTLQIPVSLHLSEVPARPGLPGKRQETLGATASVRTPSVPRLDARILLAEDHEANRQLITLRLNSTGAEVVPARNGKEAVELVHAAAAQGRPFDAVIMDMEMPVLDGYEAVRQLRAGGFTAPIVAVTAYAMSQDREECLRLGCNEHISKPIEWDRFFRELAVLLKAQEN